VTSTLPPVPPAIVGAIGRPLWNEARAPFERRALARRSVPVASGGGRRIVIATGYLAPPASADTLASWLRAADYRVDIADMARNRSTSTAAVERIEQALGDNPDRVDQLLTLGSPVRAHLPRQAVLRASVEGLRLLARLPFDPDADLDADQAYERDLSRPFDVDVPWTSIWSRVDGVVEWQTCLDEAAESAEVRCSHFGLLASTASFEAIAGALAR
jgi:hypothetical protein